jgi:hypothetical protein
MKCFLCQQETDKVNEKCLLGNPVCPRCCFHISTGAPDHINRVKKELKDTKENILAKCGACNPVK